MPMVAGDVVTGLHGRYRIESRHGEGSFGVTYGARDVSGGRPALVKELRIEKLDDWKALELFEREAEVLASLSHPNIPAFLDFFAHGGPTPLHVSAMSSYGGAERLSLVLVQELIEGTTLQQRIDHEQRLSPSEGQAVLRALLHALVYLHERTPPLVHRDIKPGNVILTPGGKPYLVDFGAIQHRIRSAGTVGSTIVGTHGYMPPEQARGQARPASDLYALGVTMVVALAGQPLEKLRFDDATGKIAIGRVLPPGTPPSLCDALDSMIALTVGQRAQSASEVLSRIDARPEAPPLAARPSPVGGGTRFEKLRTYVTMAGAFALIILVAPFLLVGRLLKDLNEKFPRAAWGAKAAFWVVLAIVVIGASIGSIASACRNGCN